MLEDGYELSPELATTLQPQLGNLALQDLLGHSSSALGSLGPESEEEQGEELVEVEEVAEDQELDGVRFGGGGGGGGSGGAGDPWDVGRLFGGDDDPDDQPNRPRPPAKAQSAEAEEAFDEDALFDEERPDEDPDALRPHELSAVERRVGSATPLDGPLEGDARYRAVEPALTEALFLGRRRLHPEDLVTVDSGADPLGRPGHIGRFLAQSADSPRARSLGRLVASASAALCPEAGGYAGAAAHVRLGQPGRSGGGGGERTDRAVRLSLADTAWPAAVAAARPLSRRGRLRAPTSSPRPWAAWWTTTAGASLAQRHGRQGPAGADAGPPAQRSPQARSRVAQAAGPLRCRRRDRRLGRGLAGADRRGPSLGGSPAGRAGAAPHLRAARLMMQSLGRAYVEVAAAALAVLEVRPEAPCGPPSTPPTRPSGRWPSAA